MSNQPLIRTMTVDDLDDVIAIENEVFTEAWTRESFVYEIKKNPYSLPIVMELNGEIIGYAVAWDIFNEFHIATIGIRKMHQGKGWGKHLFRYLMSMTDGAEFAMLEVRKDNHVAIKMYESFGFYPIYVRPRYYRDGQDAIVMRKQL